MSDHTADDTFDDATLDLFGLVDPEPARPRTSMDAAIPVPGKRRPTMARATDPAPAHVAADTLTALELSALQRAVLAAVAQHQPIHDVALERLPAFAAYSPSTVRKRRTELVQAGLVVAHDEVPHGRGRITRWRVAAQASAQETAA